MAEPGEAEIDRSPGGADRRRGAAPVTVLVVDDHRVFAESLARLLGDVEGIAVVGTCGSAAVAVELADREHPDVVLVDYELPDADGATLTRALKRSAPDVQVVMLTGHGDERVLLDAIDAGCSGFLTKERAAAEVADAIRIVADGDALISPQMLTRLLPHLARQQPRPGADLTVRERELLAGLARGLSNRAIADEMFLSVNTVRNYVQSVLAKLGAHSRLEAVSVAVRAGIIDYPRG